MTPGPSPAVATVHAAALLTATKATIATGLSATPMLVGFHGDHAAAVVLVRPASADDRHAAITEALAYLVALDAEAVLSCMDVRWRMVPHDAVPSIPPPREDPAADNGVLVALDLPAGPGPATVTPYNLDDAGKPRWGAPMEFSDSFGARSFISEMFTALWEQRDDLAPFEDLAVAIEALGHIIVEQPDQRW